MHWVSVLVCAGCGLEGVDKAFRRAAVRHLKSHGLNFNCVLLDVTSIRIGEGTQIGPAVQIYVADHPRDRETRLRGLECGKPVTVGKNVWIGGGAILLPGTTVGDDAVIGAGTVVTKDVPAGAMVVGNPGRVVGRKY